MTDTPGSERLISLTCSSCLATDKVALLIGNLSYAHHPALMAPMMDVHELANLLRQLGFRVVSLLDLTKAEMLSAIHAFLQLLDRGVYGESQTQRSRRREKFRRTGSSFAHCSFSFVSLLTCLVTCTTKKTQSQLRTPADEPVVNS